MVRIAPVRLAFNPKTLWFDAGELDLAEGDHVIVVTARGQEYGTLDKDVFDADEQQVKGLRSKLKPVKRKATDGDEAHVAELQRKSTEALPVFRRIAADTVPDMRPISVEYLFDGEKAVFYFESDERVDFRALVRKLAAELHVRVDMKQIGVRDEARMIGGIGHCGQELCCCRFGGDFNPVSIRMAKEQDLSLNPQKISGLCGRLMCCLRYEYDAYKDFHSRAPKKNAKIKTPEGTAKVTGLDVPREIVSVALEGEKPVRVPLAAMDAPEEGQARPSSIGEVAWEEACNPVREESSAGAGALFSSELDAGDRLAEPGRVSRVGSGSRRASSTGRKPRRRHGSGDAGQHREKHAQEQHAAPTRHARRRRSMRVDADGSTEVVSVGDTAEERASSKRDERAERSDRQRARGRDAQGAPSEPGHRSRRGRGGKQGSETAHGGDSGAGRAGRENRTGGKRQNGQRSGQASPGRNSSALRRECQSSSARGDAKPPKQGGSAAREGASQTSRRRRRRTHGPAKNGGGPSGSAKSSGSAPERRD